MESVEGRTAAELIADRHPDGMPFPLVAEIVAAVGSALDSAHRRGCLYDDLSPANILVFDPASGRGIRILLANRGITRTLDGVTTGESVAYAAPERLMGYEADPRADQYSLAVTAYHLLTGSPLYPDADPAVVAGRHLHGAPPRLADVRRDWAALDVVFGTALSKYPEGRFATCADFARAFASARPAAPAPDRAPTGTGFRHHTRWLPAMAMAVLVASAATIVAWQPWHGARGQPTMAASAATETAVPTLLSGTYAADFGPELELGDGRVLNPTGAHGTFAIRSTCQSGGCDAVAEATDGPTVQRRLVFDDVDGQWTAVGTTASTSPAISTGLKAGCEQGLSPEVWETMVLAPQPDGTFAGTYEVANANDCNTSRSVTVRRTGDADVSRIDDPADLPPRVSVPAEAFRGHYRYTYSTEAGAHDELGYVRTDCLRTGERCMSDFNGPDSAEPFVFSDGRWTLHYAAPVLCGTADGPTVTVARTAQLDLPQPTTDPLDVVVGSGTETVTKGPCVVPPSRYQLRFQRTGD